MSKSKIKRTNKKGKFFKIIYDQNKFVCLNCGINLSKKEDLDKHYDEHYKKEHKRILEGFLPSGKFLSA